MAEPFPSLTGQLLIASPALVDPNFWRTVVVITEHNDEGAMGLVLNRPLELVAREAVEPLAPLLTQSASLFSGGPVQPGAVIALAEFDDLTASAAVAFADIGFLGAEPDVERLASATRRIRVFLGYSGWDAGQLESELDEDAWLVEPALADDVFTDAPQELWAAVLRRRGAEGQMLAMMPVDPRLN